MKQRVCKVCVAYGLATGRAAPHPGPRCSTHWRAELKARKLRSHDLRVQQTYGLEPGEYDLLCAFQSGTCAICRRARCVGVSGKHLAVDHSHVTGVPRGLLCTFCNKDLLGRYDIAALQRAIDYLIDPPYARLRRELCKDGTL
jgi:hypothetical protein